MRRLIKGQYVALNRDIAVKARKGRSLLQLGNKGLKLKVVGPHPHLPGYYYMLNLENHHQYPPMSVFHFTEIDI